MLHRLCGPLPSLLACGVAAYVEDDVIELRLSAEEAAAGGMATISMRVPVRCPACVATAGGACARCGGERTIEELFSAWLAVAPGIAEGTLLSPSTLLPGMIRPVSFRVHLPKA